MDEKTRSGLYTNPDTVYIGVDLGSARWMLAAADRARERPIERTIEAFNISGLVKWIEECRKKLGVKAGPVVLVHEAGRDGFSVVRALEPHGIQCVVVDPASIETSARKRKAKTDKIDARMLLKKLRTYLSGDGGVFAVVRVPTEEQEDARRTSRERGRLVKEKTQHRTRIKGLLATLGLQLPIGKHLVASLKDVKTAWGTPIPANLKTELLREVERLELVAHQIEQIQAVTKKELKEPRTKAQRQGAILTSLLGVSTVTSGLLPNEFFWRDFKNRKEVAAAAGLTGTPRATGTSMDAEQGISKAGNSRVRTLMIEIAWNWVRWQPDSPITKWFQSKVDGTKRSKRKLIVAVARRLLIALWRYATQGIVPEGAILKATAH